jgi:hypothetical protein
MLLVDGSGTMFEGDSPTVWDRVRDAVLPTIDAVDGQLDVGFLAMSAEQNACPALQEVAPAKNNYAAIAAKYSAIGKPAKGESPFPLALDRAAQLLAGNVGESTCSSCSMGSPTTATTGSRTAPSTRPCGVFKSYALAVCRPTSGQGGRDADRDLLVDARRGAVSHAGSERSR